VVELTDPNFAYNVSFFEQLAAGARVVKGESVYVDHERTATFLGMPGTQYGRPA
jgi:hypothetical protein